jgi:hypothetical protein
VSSPPEACSLPPLRTGAEVIDQTRIMEKTASTSLPLFLLTDDESVSSPPVVREESTSPPGVLVEPLRT